MVNKTDVAIIILNWNAYNDTFECLKSLEMLNYEGFHVFLVDNDSQDDSFYHLQEDYNNNRFSVPITFIQTGANLGFAGGNNVAIKKSYEQGYEYFWLLNNDTEVDPNALNPLVECIEKDSQVGIVGSKIYYYGTDKIWFAGGRVNTWTAKTKHIGMGEKDYKEDIIRDVDYITGCSLLFNKKIIESVGYMLEDYFLYFEETDWNLRVKHQGFRIVFVPRSLVYHKVSKSSGGERNLSPYVQYYFIRNSLVMIKRTQNLFKVSVAYIFTLFNVLKQIVKAIFFFKHKKVKRIKYIILGFIHAMTSKMDKIN